MSQSDYELALKSEKGMKELMMECFLSLEQFCKIFFPGRFFAEFSPMHRTIFKLLDDRTPGKKVAIAAPRGTGKTSIVGLGYNAREIMFRSSRFLCYVSNTATSSELQTENLKRALLSNKPIKELFGPLKAQTVGQSLGEEFSKKSWVAQGHTLVLPRGAGQQVRGLLYGDHRPDTFVIDDLEKSDLVKSDDQREKLKEWFYSDLIKATSRVSKDWSMLYIDTLKHEDSLLQNLLDDPDWESVRLELCNDQLVSNVPTFMTDAEVVAEYEAHRHAGKLDTFYREFRNLPISTEDAVFKQEYFQDYVPHEILVQKRLEFVIIVDPAKTVKLHSADSAVVGIGLDMELNGIYFHDCVAGKMHPDELYDALFDMVARLNCKVVGIEVTSLNEFIIQPVKNEMHKRGMFFELIELNARASKEERVAQLAVYYRNRAIYHNPAVSQKLESQLITFPRSALWDVMDAFAYIVEMMELGLRYFEKFNDPIEADSKQIDPEDEEYSQLMEDNEDAIDGWRIL